MTLVGSVTDAQVSTNAPNVVVILVDDMGFSDLGCYGGEARTPNIDALAANGLKFRNFHNTARCSPTRISLLTGLYTHQAATTPGNSLPPMRTDNNITMAELLKSAGYRTYMAGKWHLGSATNQIPRARGFQHVFGIGSTQSGSGASHWNPGSYSFDSQSNEILARSYGSGTYQFYQADAIGDYAVDFLNHHFGKADSTPFFMYLPFGAPHFDIQVDKAVAEFTPTGGTSYLDLYAQGWDIIRSKRYQRMLSMGVISPLYALSPMSDSPYNGTPAYQPVPPWASLGTNRRADLARRFALYAGMIEQLDKNVGRVVNRLRTGNQLSNTLILVLSDNGCNAEGGMFGWARTGTEMTKSNNHAALTGTDLAEMGQPSRDDRISIGGGWANVGNTPFRMHKRYSHEGGIRTPLIVHWPAGISNPGRWTDQTGHVIDLMRTVVDVTGASYPTQFNGHAVLPMEGQSLAPVFREQPEFSRSLGFEHESTRAWIEGQWKLVTKTAPSTDGSSLADTLELYNTALDPTELNNLAPNQPARVVAMVDAWNDWANRVGVPSERLLPMPFNPTPAAHGDDLFLDTFSRLDSVDVDSGSGGMSGRRVPPLGLNEAYYEGFEGSGASDSIHILTGRMRIASGVGMAENGIMHNFAGADIVNAGGFSVSMQINTIKGTATDSTNRYVGFAVGLTQSEAAEGSDIGGTKSFRGSTANPSGKADFFVELDMDGYVKVWSKGQWLDNVFVGETHGTLTASFALDGFATTSSVMVNVFFNGRLLDINNGSPSSHNRSFNWENANSNYIGLSARTTDYAEIDNLAVRRLPLASALASEFVLNAGLTVPESDINADPDGDGDTNFEEWLKGGNPVGSDAARQLLAVTPSNSGEFRFSYYRSQDAVAAGVVYTFWQSTSLWNWSAFTPEEISSVAQGAGYDKVECRVPTSLTNGKPMLFIFLEAKVSGS